MFGPMAGILAASGGAAPVVNCPFPSTASHGTFIQPCWTNFQVNADGHAYDNSQGENNLYNTDNGTWLTSGLASEVWVSHDSTFNFEDAGTGRLQCNTTRNYSRQQVGPGSISGNVTFSFWDAASGGNLLDTMTANFSASVASP